jgi:hypothetical protein
VRVLYGSREMTGTRRGEPVSFHARCRKMYNLLAEARGKTDLSQLQEYFADPKYAINVGKDTIDMMVFDTTACTAYLSRGPSYKVAWRTFQFAAKP